MFTLLINLKTFYGNVNSCCFSSIFVLLLFVSTVKTSVSREFRKIAVKLARIYGKLVDLSGNHLSHVVNCHLSRLVLSTCQKVI